jgi:hypothetical protein
MKKELIDCDQLLLRVHDSLAGLAREAVFSDATRAKSQEWVELAWEGLHLARHALGGVLRRIAPEYDAQKVLAENDVRYTIADDQGSG